MNARSPRLRAHDAAPTRRPRNPRAAAAAIIVGAALLAPTPAMATTATPPVQFLTEGEVELHTATKKDEDFAPGTVYWEVQFQWSDGSRPYVATWERSEGSWESADEAKAHFNDGGIIAVLTESRQCRVAAVREIAAGTASYEEFRALSGSEQEGWTLAPETWRQIDEACAYTLKEEWEWSWERTASTTDDVGVTTVRVPLDVMGPGEHELFVAPYGYGYDPSSQEDQQCRVHTWPDGGWASHACRFEWLETATTTVTVPEPPTPTAAPADAADSADRPNAIPIVIAVGAGLALVAGAVAFIVIARRRRSTGTAP
ncbi:hypothetical protein [Microbacterium sp.]|uniref:hypothetical protein n=1 Tax=Microbacterium sp. TaxID=51671 RepID=UPI002811E0CB|nr:hypothetical protein [Microbacterium sp.]